ncbi:putative ion transporter superfamily protein YfcC [Oceanisphaera litoralis]|uniref:YfcC family protein n=1 Tax=Oceanisphaera litoralis TaxID=225144 RepID=UPI0019570B66|nr:AbgT family transporter [Oceanisphaera litoralis]MBM7454980.1 putative ion transporter superfamily protein YfcC [Oceanisphaera litoralis]
MQGNTEQENRTGTLDGLGDKPWYQKFPDPMVLIFYILLLASFLAWVVPKGAYEVETVDGRQRVIADSFHYLADDTTPLSVAGAVNQLFNIFVAIPQGLIQSAQYLFIVFIAGGLFNILYRSHALENLVGTTVRRIGLDKGHLLIWLATYLYGIFGMSVGYENNIALVPVALLVSSALGYTNLVGACIAIGGIGIGFTLSPINPYTVGVAQSIAGLPIFSGALLRFGMAFMALSLLAWYITTFVAPKHRAGEDEGGTGALSKKIEDYRLSARDLSIISVFFLGILVIAGCSYLAGTGALGRSWYIKEITAVFIVMSIVIAAICRINPNRYVADMVEGASKVTGGALVIGLAASIKVVLEDGQIIYTIVDTLNRALDFMPESLIAVGISVIQGIINLFIPSGSGQALVTMPVLIPLADLVGISYQVMILAFQVGDGLTNMIVPTSGGTLAMLALARVGYSDWIKVIFPLIALIYVLSWGFIIFAQMTHWS